MMSVRTISLTERADYLDMELAAQLGRLLPKASANALEKILAVNADDLLTRARLLGHYWTNYGASMSEPLDSKQCDHRIAHIPVSYTHLTLPTNREV